MRGLRVGAALVCALPWAAACHLPHRFRELINLVFRPLCHHWADRVLVVSGEAMCVCSRCAGLYAGLALGFLLGMPTMTTRSRRRWLGAAIVAMLVDIVTQDLGLHGPYHPVRLATGALVGWITAAWMVASLSTAAMERPQRRSLASMQRG